MRSRDPSHQFRGFRVRLMYSRTPVYVNPSRAFSDFLGCVMKDNILPQEQPSRREAFSCHRL